MILRLNRVAIPENEIVLIITNTVVMVHNVYYFHAFMLNKITA